MESNSAFTRAEITETEYIHVSYIMAGQARMSARPRAQIRNSANNLLAISQLGMKNKINCLDDVVTIHSHILLDFFLLSLSRALLNLSKIEI